MDSEKDDKSKLVIYQNCAIIFGAIFVIAVISSYVFKFGFHLSSKQEVWGQFGDYIGGVLNPAFSFLAFIFLLGTFKLQIQEIRLTEKELKNSTEALIKQNDAIRIQNFETSFFQLLRLHNDIVNSMEFIYPNGARTKTQGRDCFKAMADLLQSKLNTEPEADGKIFIIKYEQFHDDYQHKIGHYFRLLFNIIKLINNTNGIDKKFYSNLVRSQLSSAEIILLFYNCLSSYGDEKFKSLVEDYSLLKTIPNVQLPPIKLVHMYSVNAYGTSYPEKL